MIYLVVAVIFLYIISVEIVVGVLATVNSETGFGEIKIKLFFITVFKKQIDPKKILNSVKKGDVQKKTDKKTKRPSEFLIELAKNVLKRICVKNLTLNACIGTGDAAVSAVTAGLIRIVYGQACAYLYCEECGQIEPDYNAEILTGDFSGIFSLCIADIIYAVIQILLEKAAKHRSARKHNAKFIAE